MLTSVWTTGSSPVEVRLNSVWKVRLPPESRVRTCRVIGLGQKTATLMEMPFSHIKLTVELDRVSFIEREDA